LLVTNQNNVGLYNELIRLGCKSVQLPQKLAAVIPAGVVVTFNRVERTRHRNRCIIDFFKTDNKGNIFDDGYWFGSKVENVEFRVEPDGMEAM